MARLGRGTTPDLLGEGSSEHGLRRPWHWFVCTTESCNPKYAERPWLHFLCQATGETCAVSVRPAHEGFNRELSRCPSRVTELNPFLNPDSADQLGNAGKQHCVISHNQSCIKRSHKTELTLNPFCNRLSTSPGVEPYSNHYKALI